MTRNRGSNESQPRIHRDIAEQRLVSGLVFLILVTMLGACVPAQGSDPSSMGTSTTPREGVHVLLANDQVEVTSPQEMCTWPLVADAVVASYGPSHWDTPDGSRPPGLTQFALIQQGYAIFTPVRFTRMTVNRDHRSQATTEYVVLGGIVWPDSWEDNSFPRPKVGQRVLMVFAPSQLAGGSRFTQATLLVYQAFSIDSFGMVTLQRQTVEQGQISQREVKLPLSEVRTDLSQCP